MGEMRDDASRIRQPHTPVLHESDKDSNSDSDFENSAPPSPSYGSSRSNTQRSVRSENSMQRDIKDVNEAEPSREAPYGDADNSTIAGIALVSLSNAKMHVLTLVLCTLNYFHCRELVGMT